MTGYLKQYTENDVKKALRESNGLMLAKLQENIGCSEMTLRNLLKPMIKAGDVTKKNIGVSEKRPVNVYSLGERQ